MSGREEYFEGAGKAPGGKQGRRSPNASRGAVPTSAEAERAVLGCCLLAEIYRGSEAEGLAQCEELGVTGEWFYDLRHRTIFEVMMGLHRAGQRPDLVTVNVALRDGGRLEEIGGPSCLAQLAQGVPGLSNLGQYAGTLREKYLLREVGRVCEEGVGSVYEVNAQPEPILGQVERQVLLLQQEGTAVTEQRMREIVSEVMSGLEEYHRGRAQMRGLESGLEYVDKLLCGIGGDNGNYIVLSGRPGTGKTSLATQMAEYAACDYVWWEPLIEKSQGPRPMIGGNPKLQPVMETVDGVERVKCERRVGIPVGVFSLEMAKRPLVQRMLFQRAAADMQRWRTGYAESEAMPKILRASLELMRPENVWIDDTARTTIESLRAKARRWQRQHGIKLFVIDYIQLLRSGGKRFRQDRVQELAEISAEIQALGKDLNVPIIVIAQMNRDFEKEPTRQPRLSDLKDCGSIEQDADVVGFLYSPKLREKESEQYDRAMTRVYGAYDWSKRPKRVNLVFQKNRYGPTGSCALLFQKSCTRFYDYNVWLKENDEKELAKGEERQANLTEGEES